MLKAVVLAGVCFAFNVYADSNKLTRGIFDYRTAHNNDDSRHLTYTNDHEVSVGFVPKPKPGEKHSPGPVYYKMRNVKNYSNSAFNKGAKQGNLIGKIHAPKIFSDEPELPSQGSDSPHSPEPQQSPDSQQWHHFSDSSDSPIIVLEQERVPVQVTEDEKSQMIARFIPRTSQQHDTAASKPMEVHGAKQGYPIGSLVDLSDNSLDATGRYAQDHQPPMYAHQDISPLVLLLLALMQSHAGRHRHPLPGSGGYGGMPWLKRIAQSTQQLPGQQRPHITNDMPWVHYATHANEDDHGQQDHFDHHDDYHHHDYQGGQNFAVLQKYQQKPQRTQKFHGSLPYQRPQEHPIVSEHELPYLQGKSYAALHPGKKQMQQAAINAALQKLYRSQKSLYRKEMPELSSHESKNEHEPQAAEHALRQEIALTNDAALENQIKQSAYLSNELPKQESDENHHLIGAVIHKKVPTASSHGKHPGMEYYRNSKHDVHTLKLDDALKQHKKNRLTLDGALKKHADNEETLKNAMGRSEQAGLDSALQQHAQNHKTLVEALRKHTDNEHILKKALLKEAHIARTEAVQENHNRAETMNQESESPVDVSDDKLHDVVQERAGKELPQEISREELKKSFKAAVEDAGLQRMLNYAVNQVEAKDDNDLSGLHKNAGNEAEEYLQAVEEAKNELKPKASLRRVHVYENEEE